MTSLLELPGNKGQVFAINPHRVSGVQPYEGTLAGKTGVWPLAIVWVDNHNLFVCGWPFEDTLKALNEARQADAALFAAGFEAAMKLNDWAEPWVTPEKLMAAWKTYLGEVAG